MTRAKLTEVAWLAGLLDGEGSVGSAIEKKKGRAAGGTDGWSIRPSMQMSITERPGLDAALIVLDKLKITAPRYSYTEKNPERHLPAWHLRVNRQADIRILARAVLPYAVIKKPHWTLLLAFVESRLSRVELDSQGRMRRGGTCANPYTAEEIELAQALRKLNGRGPATERREIPWEELGRRARERLKSVTSD